MTRPTTARSLKASLVPSKHENAPDPKKARGPTMTTRIAINGFGRVGRSVLRAAYAQEAAIEIVAINDITDAATLAHLLRYDSVYGRFPGTVEVAGGDLVVDGLVIRALAEPSPATS